MKKDDETFSESEAERRRDETLKTMLRTKPQPNWRPPNARPHATTGARRRKRVESAKATTGR